MTWKLKCLLCDEQSGYLVALQEHAMNEHGYTREDHQKTTKRATDDGDYIYTFPDGKDWMQATRTGGNTLDGL